MTDRTMQEISNDYFKHCQTLGDAEFRLDALPREISELKSKMRAIQKEAKRVQDKNTELQKALAEKAAAEQKEKEAIIPAKPDPLKVVEDEKPV